MLKYVKYNMLKDCIASELLFYDRNKTHQDMLSAIHNPTIDYFSLKVYRKIIYSIQR